LYNTNLNSAKFFSSPDQLTLYTNLNGAKIHLFGSPDQVALYTNLNSAQFFSSPDQITLYTNLNGANFLTAWIRKAVLGAGGPNAL
jgi:hypothetical protein